MNETMWSRLVRLTRDVDDVYRVDTLCKCKTLDGMIYTMNVTEFHRDECPREMDFAEYISSGAARVLTERTEEVSDGKGFLITYHENVAVRKDQIARVWVELGDAYHNGPIIE